MSYNEDLVNAYLKEKVAVLIMKTDSDDDIAAFQSAIDDVHGSHVEYGGSLRSIPDWVNNVLRTRRSEDGMYIARTGGSTGFCNGRYYRQNGYELAELRDMLTSDTQEQYSSSDFDEVFS